MHLVARRLPNAARVPRGLRGYRRFRGSRQSVVHPAPASSRQVQPIATRHDKLCSVTSNFRDEGNVTYQYGGDGKRRIRTAGSNLTYYWWDAGYNVIEESVNGIFAVPNIHYVIDDPASSRGNVLADIQGYDAVTGTPRYYSHDHLGSTRTIRNQAKAALARFDYDPYGAPVSQGASATRTYTGHDFDSTAGMYFAPYRYYAPGLARWTERDPQHVLLRYHAYNYVGGNSINHIDLHGDLAAIWWALIAAGVISLVLAGDCAGTMSTAMSYWGNSGNTPEFQLDDPNEDVSEEEKGYREFMRHCGAACEVSSRAMLGSACVSLTQGRRAVSPQEKTAEGAGMGLPLPKGAGNSINSLRNACRSGCLARWNATHPEYPVEN